MRPVVFLLAATVVAGCLVAEDLDDAPAGPWRMSSEVVAGERFCGDCHYGMERFWDARWQAGNASGTGAPAATWDLTVRPAYPEAPLHAVQVLAAGEAPVAAALGPVAHDWSIGETWREELDVPADATAVFARVHASPAPGAAATVTGATANRQNTYTTSLALVAPDGTRTVADGPDQDLKALTVPAVPGTWALEATLVDGMTGAVGTMWAEALRGEVLAEVPAEGARFMFAANATGAPPPTDLRLRPFHDHDPYENTDWDLYDMSPFLEAFRPVTGAPPDPPAWTQARIEALWDGARERVVLERSGTFAAAYVDEEGHNDPGAGSDYPYFTLPGDPVPPGTSLLRMELTWSPPVDEPALGIRYSAHGSPYFHDAEAVERHPGRAVFEVPVRPHEWEDPDQTMAHTDTDRPISHWDIAPRLKADAWAGVLDWDLVVTAARG